MKTVKIGDGPFIGIVACLHGNEPLGKEVIDLLLDDLPSGNFVFLVVNSEAIEKNTRYIDRDLNRSFPGKKDGCHEEKLAVRVLEELKQCDFVIDIHTTMSKTESFVILTEESETNMEVARAFPLEKLVFMTEVSNGTALLDHAEGISIEFNKEVKPEKVKNMILDCLSNLKNGKKISKEVFDVYGGFSSEEKEKLENFKLCKEGFYPVLYGEKENKGIKCRKARKRGQNA